MSFCTAHFYADLMILKYIIFTGAVQGLFLVLLLRKKTTNQLANKWLINWLILVSIQLFFYFDNLSASTVTTGFSGIIAFSIPLLTAPALFQYISSISFGKVPDFKKNIVYIAPWLVYLTLTIAANFIYPNGISIRYGYPQFSPDVPAIVVYIFTLPMAFIPGIYALMGLTVLRAYRKNLPDHYSYTERISLNWLKWLVISILVLFILLFLLIRFGRQQQIVNTENLFNYVGAALSIYVFIIGYMGMCQESTTSTTKKEMPDEKPADPIPYKKTGLDEISAAQLYQRLLGHMEKEKPYLRDDLSLSILAQQIGVNPNQLSQAINQKSANNFFVFVNTYRVDEVKTKLLDPGLSHLSILGIAYDCGFRSKSAFNRIFKTQTGIGPLEYQKQHKKN